MTLQTHVLRSGSSRTVVGEHGAQVLEWSDGDRELLFLSPGADLSGVGAVRGGIPVCFPWFGPRPGLPQHGFARTSRWSVAHRADDRISLSLRDDERTRAVWDHGFRATLDVVLSPDSLALELAVHNTSPDAWDFTAAFHPYFRVADSRTAGVRGIPADDAEAVHDALRAGRVLDVRVPGRADPTLEDGSAALAVGAGDAFDATQVWNPGAGHTLGDLPGDSWREFVCVEPVRAESPLPLASGTSAVLRMTLAPRAA